MGMSADEFELLQRIATATEESVALQARILAALQDAAADREQERLREMGRRG